MPIIPKSEFKQPSAWRSGRWKMRRSVSAVSIARSEYLNCPPRVPTRPGAQAAMASGATHRVTSPRPTRARS